MGRRLGIAGFPNSGKSYSRRYIPDGNNCMVIAPSVKASYLYTGPSGAHTLTPTQIDQAIKEGSRTMLGEFEMTSPEAKFKDIQDAIEKFPSRAPDTDLFDVLNLFNIKRPLGGYFKPSNVLGNTIHAPRFEQLKIATRFVDLHLPWIHTLILPDFTHYITEKITSDDFLNRRYGNDAFGRYVDLAADAFKSFIKASDILRKDLIVITEYHVEENKDLKRFEIFVPGGKMVKEKFLPSSYYDQFLFTDVEYASSDDSAEAKYRYVTRNTRIYPEARSGGLYEEMYVDSNVQDILTRMRKHYNIPIKY